MIRPIHLHEWSGERRHPLLGVALVFACGVSTVVAPAPAEAWGKKKKAKSFTSAPSQQKLASAASKILQKARSMREKGKNGEAIELYKQALGADSSIAEAWLELAEIYIDINIPEKAAEMYESGLPLAEQQEADPATLADLWCRVAELHVRLGRPDLASGDLVKATTLAPASSRPHKISGDIYAAGQRNDDAFKAYREAVRLDPQDAEAWFALGQLGLLVKRAKEAQDAYRGLLQADSARAAEFAEMMRQAHLEPAAPASVPTAAPAGDDPYATTSAPAERPKSRSAVTPDPHDAGSGPPAPGWRSSGGPASVTAPVPRATPIQTTRKPVIASAPTVVQPRALPASEAVAAPSPAPASEPASGRTPLSDALLQAMVDRLFEEDPAMTDKAVEELALYADQALPLIRERLPDPDPDRRIRLIRALGGMKSVASAAALLLEEASLDPDPGVQAAADEALTRLKAE